MGRRKVEKVDLRIVGSPFLNVEEAAEFLKVKKSTIYSWIHKKQETGVPVRHHGRKPVFLREALMQWSNEQNGIVPKVG
jgi:excisionase family DNA binding protein